MPEDNILAATPLNKLKHTVVETNWFITKPEKKPQKNVSSWSPLASLWDIKYFPEHIGKKAQHKQKTTKKTEQNFCSGQKRYNDSGFWIVTLPQHIQPFIYYLAPLILLCRVVLAVTDWETGYILGKSSHHHRAPQNVLCVALSPLCGHNIHPLLC